MYSILNPKDGPVFEGLEQREIIFAKDQPEYKPLRAVVSHGEERRVVTRWALTPDQRQAVADGADIYLALLTFHHPLQPIVMAVGDGDLDLADALSVRD